MSPLIKALSKFVEEEKKTTVARIQNACLAEAITFVGSFMTLRFMSL